MVWVKGELLDSFAEAERLGADQLSRAAQPFLFNRLDWFRRVWEKTPPSEALLIGRAQRERGFCWLFLSADASGRGTALANWYNFSFAPVLSGEVDESALRTMLIALGRRMRTRLTRLTAQPMRETDARTMLDAFRKAGWTGWLRQSSTRWVADTEGMTFADYWAARPGQLRNTAKRKGAKSDLDCKVHTGFNDALWQAYEDVYAESWKTDEGSPAFLRDMAESEAAHGFLRLGLAFHEGQPVAAQLWTVENGIALIHKLSYKESARELSVGTLLSEVMFRHVIDEDKVALIDFGTGDDGYKRDWMDRSEPLLELRLYNTRTLDGLLGAAKHWLRLRLGRAQPF